MVKHGFNSLNAGFARLNQGFNKTKLSLATIKPSFNVKYQIKLKELLNQCLILL